MKKNKLLLFVALSALLGCNSSDTSTPTTSLEDDFKSAKAKEEELKVSQKIIDELIHTMPSPIEMSSMIKESGADYNNSLLNETSQASNYINDEKKALNLGVYGVDLGYMNLYNKNLSLLDYLSSIRNLSSDLGVGQFFDFTTLKRLSESKDNIDSLIDLTTTGFISMDDFLRSKSRGDISMLILTGSWIEGMYLSTQIIDKSNKNEELRNRIGEQKVIINDLTKILSVFKNNPVFTGLTNEFSKLKGAYDKVNLVYVYKEPKYKEVDGELIIEDNNTCQVEMSDLVLKEITNEISSIRNNIVKK